MVEGDKISIGENMKDKLKAYKSKKRRVRYEEIKNRDLVGKIINVIILRPNFHAKETGELKFYNNSKPHTKNTGYYLGKKQIPLLQIKEIGRNYIELK